MSTEEQSGVSGGGAGSGVPRTVLDTTLVLALVSTIGYSYSLAYFVGYCNWFRIPWALISVSVAQYLYVVAFELPGILIAAVALVLFWPQVDRLKEEHVVAWAPILILTGVTAVAASLSSLRPGDIGSLGVGIVLPAVVAAVAYLALHKFVRKPVGQAIASLGRRRFVVVVFALFGFAVSAFSGAWWAANRTEFEIMTVSKAKYVVLQFFGDNVIAAPVEGNRLDILRPCIRLFKLEDKDVSTMEIMDLGAVQLEPTTTYDPSWPNQPVCQ